LGFKTETDYRITKGTGWLEIMVAEWSNNAESIEEYNGFARNGNRVVYQVIFACYENDVRF
jgi:phenylalanyl-tRNA synthetase alpha chain